MGFNDARQFRKRFEEIFGYPPEQAPNGLPPLEWLEKLYDKGFDDGAKAHAEYDPRWDAD